MDLRSLPGSSTNGYSFIINANYTQCEYDSCVYFKQNYNDPTYLLLYIDDMLITAKNKAHIQMIKLQLKRKFDMKDMSEAKKILGMRSLETKIQADFDNPKRTLL